jgi:hypothetical protein
MPKTAVMLDVFPVTASMLPPKVASVLDIQPLYVRFLPSKAVTILNMPYSHSTPTPLAVHPQVLSHILDVTASLPSTTPPPVLRRPSVANLRLPGLAIADKVVDRLGVSIPIGPPLPTWSELSTLSIHLYPSTTAAASGLELKLGAKKSRGSGSATSSGLFSVQTSIVSPSNELR